MRRRSLVMGLATAAGCADLTGGASTASPTPTTRAPRLRVERFVVDGPVEIGAPVRLELAVSNSGAMAGTFHSPISRRLDRGEWEDTEHAVNIDIPAGESRTERLELQPVGVMVPATYRLDAVEMTAPTVFVGASIAWGDGHTLPNGIRLTVSAPLLGETYTYPTADGDRTVTPPEGEQWAVYTVAATNTAKSQQTAPGLIDLVLHREDDEFRGATFDGDNQAQYRGGPLAPGAQRSGEIPADIPADIGVADLRVDFAGTFEAGTAEVTWRSVG